MSEIRYRFQVRSGVYAGGYFYRVVFIEDDGGPIVERYACTIAGAYRQVAALAEALAARVRECPSCGGVTPIHSETCQLPELTSGYL